MAVIDLRIVGGHVALDLVNTVEPRTPEGTEFREHLNSPTDLMSWAVRLGILTDTESEQVRAAWDASPTAGEQALRASLEIREATYDVLLTVLGTAPNPRPDAARALDHLGLRWAAATARSALTFGGEALTLFVGTAPATLVPDRLAITTVEFLRTGDTNHVRACPLDEGGCGWFFLDRSRNGSRRWCAMGDCGVQAKSRRLTARRREARAAT
ncbi:CGNR zinc finger domain-containing protein [Cryptosporangium sp. NPDC051539]|uniref:CGNR zinc finger domain-containing protein n=1 Tax=Cryptosporangium sp. NPDC051539 TaxID=3363962 RepID=UPI0037A6304D